MDTPGLPTQPWFAQACEHQIVRRATRVALVVGTILVAINHGDRIWRGTLDTLAWAKIALTYCVPYCVSTYSAVSALRARDMG